jgi:site-specific DNA-methyltransferase (adenine-specific)
VNAVVQANALALPPAFAADADVMIVDPPYSAHVHKNAASMGSSGRGGVKRDLGFDHCSPDLMLRLAAIAAQVRRWSCIFTDVESVSAWRAALVGFGCEYVRSVPWVRWSQPQLSGDRPPTGCEMIVIAHAPRARIRETTGAGKMWWNGPGNRVSYTAKSLRGADKYSGEKPLDLMLALVSDFSDPGETVIDPCAGMGTTCVAAALLGRESIGLERKAAIAAEAEARVELATPGLLRSVLIDRDAERVARWIEETRAEAEATPAPKAANGSDVKTWERAQRRLADVARVERALKGES